MRGVLKNWERFIHLVFYQLGLRESFLGSSDRELAFLQHVWDLAKVLYSSLGEFRQKLEFSSESFSRVFKSLKLVCHSDEGSNGWWLYHEV